MGLKDSFYPSTPFDKLPGNGAQSLQHSCCRALELLRICWLGNSVGLRL